MLGPGFCIAMYYLMWKHTHVFLTIIAKALRKRLGVYFGMLWTTIGVVITFNVVFNHVMAMIIKPGSPTDLAVSGPKLIVGADSGEITSVLQRAARPEGGVDGARPGPVRRLLVRVQQRKV